MKTSSDTNRARGPGPRKPAGRIGSPKTSQPGARGPQRTPTKRKRAAHDRQALQPRQPGPPTTGAATPKTASRFRRRTRIALLALLIAIATNEACIAMASSRMARAVSTRELEQLPDAWTEYDRLSRRSYLHIGTIELEHSLVEQTSSLVERVMANYRAPATTVREAQWEMARGALVRALAATGSNRPLRAALRYCEGQLYRINGEAKKARGEFAAAQRDLTEAVVAFREAARASSEMARSVPWIVAHVYRRPRRRRSRRGCAESGAEERTPAKRS